jgi:hypothetical protein
MLKKVPIPTQVEICCTKLMHRLVGHNCFTIEGARVRCGIQYQCHITCGLFWKLEIGMNNNLVGTYYQHHDSLVGFSQLADHCLESTPTHN